MTATNLGLSAARTINLQLQFCNSYLVCTWQARYQREATGSLGLEIFTSAPTLASSEPGHKDRMKEEEEGANTRVEIGFSSCFSFCKTGKILLVSPVTRTRCLKLLGGTALQQCKRAFERRRWTSLSGESFDVKGIYGK